MEFIEKGMVITMDRRERRIERRIQENRIRRRRERRKHIVMFFLTACLVVTLSVTISGFLSKAQSENETLEFKYYESVMIEKGDSLWSIAKENMNPRYYKNTNAYIKEIMTINGLSNDSITAGNYLVIPYFSSEFVG